jgi:four helix bundle protein
MGAQTFRDVELWQKAHRFVLEVYRYTEKFPKHELFGLSAQFRRAAVSIPANFAEGFRRKGPADKIRFYNVSQGSLEECRYYLILCQDLGYGENSASADLLEEVSRMLQRYIGCVRATPITNRG